MASFTIEEIFLTENLTKYHQGPYYSFQYAFEDAQTRLSLYQAGCRFGDEWNCTAACLDPVLGPPIMWNGPDAMYTLQNCLVFPIIAYLLANGSLHDPSNLTSIYAIPASKDYLAQQQQAWPIINNCTNTFFHNSHLLPVDLEPVYYLPELDGSPVNLQVNTSMCVCISAPVNSDIGGIGMIVAFITQSLCVIFLLTVLLINSQRLPYSLFFGSSVLSRAVGVITGRNRRVNDPSAIGLVTGTTEEEHHDHESTRTHEREKFPKKLWRETKAMWKGYTDGLHSGWNSDIWNTEDRVKLWKRAGKLKETLRDTLQYAAFQAGLDFFQTTQVFFVVSVQIACLYGIYFSDSFEAATWRQLSNDFDFIRYLAMSGCAPVALTSLIQRYASKTEPEEDTDPESKALTAYTLVITGFTVLLAIVTDIIASLRSHEWSDIVSSGPPVPACGGVSTPLIYCYSWGHGPFNPLDVGGAWQWLLISFFALLALLAEKFPVLLKRLHLDDLLDKCLASYAQVSGTRIPKKKITQPLLWVCMIVIYLEFIALTIVTLCLMVAYFTLLPGFGTNCLHVSDPKYDGGHATADLDASWTLGQIISVLIWFPVAAEYFNILFNGPEEGFRRRLDENHEVVHVP